MARYSVFVTRVAEYEVEADTSEDAQDAVLTASAFNASAFIASGVPQVIDEVTTSTEVVEIDERMVVQVVFEHRSGTQSSRYAYAVPEGLDVRIDDEVLVPPNGTFRSQPSLARVVDVGRGGYAGPLAELVGKVVRAPEPVPAAWEASYAHEDGCEYDPEDRDDYDRGYGLCPDCGYGFFSADSRPCGGVMS